MPYSKKSEDSEKIEEAVTLLLESGPEDRATVIELLKEDGYSGNEIMEALGLAATREIEK